MAQLKNDGVETLPIRRQESPLSFVSIALHWIVAVGVIGMMGLGIYMHEFSVNELYATHKSVGVILMLAIAARVAWRLWQGWPVPVGSREEWETKLSRIVHWTLLIGALLFPLSGIWRSVFLGHGVFVFGVELIPYNVNAGGNVEAINAGLAGVGAAIHGALGKIFILAVLLHILGALKHQLVDGDATLRRMLGRSS